MKTKRNTPKNKQTAWTELYRGKVAGLAYYDAQLFNPKAGDKLELYHEPGNQYDSKAIRVELSGKGKIGFIPADNTDAFHRAKVRGAQFRARVVSWNKDNPSWTRCIMLVEVTDMLPTESTGKF